MKYTEMKAAELKEMAKERKVKNWWTLKKQDIIDALEAQDKAAEELKAAEKKAAEELFNKTRDEFESKKEVKVVESKKEESNCVTLTQICDDLGINAKKARRILRNKNIEKPGKTWNWSTDQVDAIKDLLK